MYTIIVVGKGKLASAILDNLKSQDTGNKIIKNIQPYEQGMAIEENSIFIHVGSGREYETVLNIAVQNSSMFIQAATEKDIHMPPPNDNTIPFIHAPNLDIHIIKFMYWLKTNAVLFKGDTISITESHQQRKQSVPGTAYRIAEFLGIDGEKIESIRDPEIQKTLGIKSLDQHAYHSIKIGEGDSIITLQTKIEGLLPYVAGLYKIIKAVPKLEARNYEIEELVQDKLL